MSGWVAPYFSPGSARVVFILGICSPLLGSCPSCFESTCASERDLGDCAHAKDVVLVRASMTYGVRAFCLFKFCFVLWCMCACMYPCFDLFSIVIFFQYREVGL